MSAGAGDWSSAEAIIGELIGLLVRCGCRDCRVVFMSAELCRSFFVPHRNLLTFLKIFIDRLVRLPLPPRPELLLFVPALDAPRG